MNMIVSKLQPEFDFVHIVSNSFTRICLKLLFTLLYLSDFKKLNRVLVIHYL